MQNILITGASSGFGKELALKYAKELDNITLFLIARRLENLKSLKNDIDTMKKNIKVEIMQLDVRDLDSIKQKCQNLDIDILVNNAGLAREKVSAEMADFKDWEEMIDVNVKALSFLTLLLLPNMVKKKSGHIINLGSIAGTYAYPGSGVYGASKAFVKQFSKNLRADLYDKNIRVSNIEPGLCDGSDFSLVRFKGDLEKVKNTYSKTTPLHAQDIANIIFFITQLPEHININSIEIMPTTQASGDLVVYNNKQ